MKIPYFSVTNTNDATVIIPYASNSIPNKASQVDYCSHLAIVQNVTMPCERLDILID